MAVKICQLAPSGVPTRRYGSFANKLAQMVSGAGALAGAEAFGDIAVHRTLPVSGIPSAEAIGTALIQLMTLGVAGIASSEAWGNPSITQARGNVTRLSPIGVSGKRYGSFGLKTLGLSPVGIPSDEGFGQLLTDLGLKQILMTGIATEESLGSVNTIGGTSTLLPNGIASLHAVGAPSLFSGFLVAPTGIGHGAIRVQWTPNSEPDLAGYRIYWGTVTGVYTGVVDVGMTATPATPEYILSNLVPGVTYFVAITAYDFSNNESGFSQESAGSSAGTRFGGVALLLQNTIEVAGMASGEAFGTLVVVRGGVTLAPASIVSAQVFGTPVCLPAYFITPSGMSSAEVFGDAVLQHSGQILALAAIGSGEAVGLLTVLRGAVSILSPSVHAGEVMGSHTVTPGPVQLNPSALLSGEAWGLPALTVGSALLVPTGVASLQQFGPVVVLPDNVLVPTGIPNGHIQCGWASSTVPNQTGYRIYLGTSSGSYSIVVDVPLTGEPFFDVVVSNLVPQQLYWIVVHVVAAGNIESVHVPEFTLVADHSGFGSDITFSTQISVTVSSITPSEGFGGPSVIPGTITVLLPGLISRELVGTALISAGELVVVPVSLSPDEAVGTVTLGVGGVSVAVPGLLSSEVFGIPQLNIGVLVLGPAGNIGSLEVIGEPVFQSGDALVRGIGVLSGEAWGAPALHRQIVIPGIGTAELIGTVSCVPRLEPVGILTREAVSTPTLSLGLTSLLPASIISAERFGSLVVALVGGYKPFRTFAAKVRPFLQRW